MHFISSDLTFGIFYKLWGFSKLMEFLWNFWDGFCENGFKSPCIASHLHYNTVSCILDVCLLCWNDCVLVGLDWAEPMMFLLLHTTCSCIFMHTYLTFSITPKRKSTPSRNPLRSGASFSSNPTPFHVQFHDDKARQDFSENFSRRGIHSERQVILSDFSDTNLPVVIHSGGWESLCDVRSIVHSCLNMSSTPTCMDLIIQYLSLPLAFEVHASWSLRILYPMCSMSLG